MDFRHNEPTDVRKKMKIVLACFFALAVVMLLFSWRMVALMDGGYVSQRRGWKDGRHIEAEELSRIKPLWKTEDFPNR